jgi:hypothetical protein
MSANAKYMKKRRENLLPEINISENCVKITSLSDEYFHGELSPDEKNIADEHLKSCKTCAEFYENERKYFEEIKSAGFAPEIDVAKSVMDKIIAETITVSKPAKKRFIPFGFITAAALVIITFALSRTNVFRIFDQSAGSGSINAEQNSFSDRFSDNGAQSYFGTIADDEESENDSADMRGEIQIAETASADEAVPEYEETEAQPKTLFAGAMTEVPAEDNAAADEAAPEMAAPAAEAPAVNHALSVSDGYADYEVSEIISINRTVSGGANIDEDLSSLKKMIFANIEILYDNYTEIIVRKEDTGKIHENLNVNSLKSEITLNKGVVSEYAKIKFIYPAE